MWRGYNVTAALFSGSDVVAEVRRLAVLCPDRIAGADYVRVGAPCCLVGCALTNLGVPLDVLKKYEDRSAYSLIRLLSIEASFEQRYWLRYVQAAQDGYAGYCQRVHTWNEAVAAADLARKVP